ncbi:MAG: aspartate/glutamate racemase family protein [Deltaproteobacteria bacterium]|nr:aspartate/glutamate racemase family protein [Deltaproteobacteria bacterium]
MYGSRGRIGLIVPSSNTVCEPEMAKLSPEGVATYSTRILFEPSLDGLKAMKEHVERASLELSSEGISNIIAFCCTVGSMIGGPGYDREIVQFVEEKTGVPAITTTTAVKAAFNAFGVKRIAVATPYTREINEIERNMLQAMGYEVTQIVGRHEDVSPNQFTNEMIGRLPSEEAYRLGLAVDGGSNEAIFISCTNFHAVEIIDRLENEAGKPVVSSNQATMWYALRKMGIRDPLPGFGRLMEDF